MAIHEHNLYEPDNRGRHGRPRRSSAPDDHAVVNDRSRDQSARRFVLALECDLRLASLDLWASGWSPLELIEEVRTSTGISETTDLVARALIVDDSHRGEQARPADWCDALTSLRAMTGTTDVATGWIARWVTEHDDPDAAVGALQATLSALLELLDPVPT